MSRIRLDKQIKVSTTPASLVRTNSSNELEYFAPSTGADRILFYDDSAVDVAWLNLGSNLSISGTTLNATAGAGGYATIQEEGSTVGGGNTTINFIGAFTAADAGGSVTSISLDADLNAIAALAGTSGFLKKTAADTWTLDTSTYLTANQTITLSGDTTGSGTTAITTTLATVNSNVGGFGSPTQVGTFTVNAKGLITAAGNSTIQIAQSQVTDLVTDLSGKQPLDATLTAFAAYNTNGILVQTAADTFVGRSIIGTADRITLTNGSGVTANPTVDIASTYAGQNTIITVGTIVTGTWNATAIGDTYISSASTWNAKQVGIEFQNEGVTLGTVGTVDTIDFTGAAVTASRIGNVLTVDIPATSGVTNLAYTTAASDGTVTSDTGTDATIPAATTSLAGLMTSADKTKLDGIATSANNYVHPNHSGDATSAGDGAITLATVNSNIGSFGSSTAIPVVTVNGKGLVTAVSTASITGLPSGSTGQILRHNGSAWVAFSGTSTNDVLTWNGSAWVSSSNPADGITSLNGLMGATQTFVDDTNVTMVSTGTTHTLTWAGTLADGRIASASTWNNKVTSISGVTNRTTITGTTTVPIVDIAATYVGQTSLTTLGTITTGTWNGTAIGTAYGGVPTGGTTGQVLTKNSNSDYDLIWSTSAADLNGIFSSANNNTTIAIERANIGATNDFIINGTGIFPNTSNITIGQFTTPGTWDYETIGNVGVYIGEQGEAIAATLLCSVDGSNSFVSAGSYGLSIVASTNLWLGTPNVYALTATTGQYLKLIDGSTGEAEWANLPASGTVTSVAATAPAAGFTISGSPITTSGTFVFTLADDLAAVEALSGTGYAVRTASNTWTTRTITAGSSKVDVQNGSGVSGNTTIDVTEANLDIGNMGGVLPITSGGTGQITAQDAIDALVPDQTTHAGDFLTTNGANVSWATLPAAPLDGSGTTNEIAYWVDSDTLGALAVATYPSLTELSYVKGVTSAIQTQIDGKQPLDATLTALAAYNTNGILTQTSADTFTGRTITGTANEITVTNGSGVSGNPTLSLPSALTFTGKTITGGTYNTITIGTTPTMTLGTDATGDIYYRNSSGFLTRLGVGTNGHVLTLAAGLPSWAAAGGGTIDGSGTGGYVTKWSDSDTLTDSLLYSDGTTGVVIGATTAAAKFHVKGAGTTTGALFLLEDSAGTDRMTMTDAGNTNIVATLAVGQSGAIEASAALEVESTAKGFLPPRMTTAQKVAISSPAEGLVVFDTDLNILCVYNGSAWTTYYPNNRITKKVSANETHSTNTTFNDLSDLSFDVVNGSVYVVTGVIMSSADAATIGLKWDFGGGSATGSIVYAVDSNVTLTGAQRRNEDALTDAVTFAGHNDVNVRQVNTVYAIFSCTGDGTLIPRFSTEITSNVVTIYQNSAMTVELI